MSASYWGRIATTDEIITELGRSRVPRAAAG